MSAAESFDDLGGDGTNTRRNGEAERLGCLEVDYELETGRLLNRQIASLLALENPASIFAHHLKALVTVRSVTHKAAGRANKIIAAAEQLAIPAMYFRREFALGEKQRTATGPDHERIGPHLGQACQC